MEQLDIIFSRLTKQYYTEVKSILYDPSSYEQKVNLKAIKQILKFLETNLDNYYEYLRAIETYIYEITSTHLIDSLLPFRFLSLEARQQINARIEICDEFYGCIDQIKNVG